VNDANTPLGRRAELESERVLVVSFELVERVLGIASSALGHRNALEVGHEQAD